jgi:hypothetical protein
VQLPQVHHVLPHLVVLLLPRTQPALQRLAEPVWLVDVVVLGLLVVVVVMVVGRVAMQALVVACWSRVVVQWEQATFFFIGAEKPPTSAASFFSPSLSPFPVCLRLSLYLAD